MRPEPVQFWLDNVLELWQFYQNTVRGIPMADKMVTFALCALLLLIPAVGSAGSSQAQSSSYWINLVTEENSLAASLLYIPYTIVIGPIRLIDGFINPVPTSQSTIPPAAHRTH
jgi:hypothetical protein